MLIVDWIFTQITCKAKEIFTDRRLFASILFLQAFLVFAEICVWRWALQIRNISWEMGGEGLMSEAESLTWLLFFSYLSVNAVFLPMVLLIGGRALIRQGTSGEKKKCE